MPEPDIDLWLKLVEEFHAFANERDFIRVVELQPKGPRRDRRRERRQSRPFFNDDRPEAGALREESGRASDDAAADDDDVGAVVSYR